MALVTRCCSSSDGRKKSKTYKEAKWRSGDLCTMQDRGGSSRDVLMLAAADARAAEGRCGLKEKKEQAKTSLMNVKCLSLP